MFVRPMATERGAQMILGFELVDGRVVELPPASSLAEAGAMASACANGAPRAKRKQAVSISKFCSFTIPTPNSRPGNVDGIY